MSKIEQLIGEIEEFIDGCKLQPFSSTKIVVDKAQLEDLLVELRHRTPDEIKKYQKILNNKDAIINDAKQQAEAIISAANVQTSEMVNQSEITKRAYARANEIITQATQQANEIVNKAIEDANALRTGAIAYTDDMMGSMEQTLAQGLDGLKEKYEEMLSTMNTTVETISANRKELPKAEDVIISAAPADTAEEEQSYRPLPDAAVFPFLSLNKSKFNYSEKENIDCCTAQIKNAQVCNEISENQIAARLGAPEYEHRYRQSQVKKDRWLICNAKKVY